MNSRMLLRVSTSVLRWCLTTEWAYCCHVAKSCSVKHIDSGSSAAMGTFQGYPGGEGIPLPITVGSPLDIQTVLLSGNPPRLSSKRDVTVVVVLLPGGGASVDRAKSVAECNYNTPRCGSLSVTQEGRDMACKVIHRHSSHGQPRCGIRPAGSVMVSDNDADVTCRKCLRSPSDSREDGEMVDDARPTERERLIAGYEEELRRVLDRESELRDLIARLSTPLSGKRRAASKARGRMVYSEAEMLRMRAHGTYMFMLKYFEPQERDAFRAVYKDNDVHAAIRAMEETLKKAQRMES